MIVVVRSAQGVLKARDTTPMNDEPSNDERCHTGESIWYTRTRAFIPNYTVAIKVVLDGRRMS